VQSYKHNSHFDFPVNNHGRVRSPFGEATGTPIQSVYANGAEGQVVVDEALPTHLVTWRVLAIVVDLLDGSRGDIEVASCGLTGTNQNADFRDTLPVPPKTPSACPWCGCWARGGHLHVADLDILDNTPLLDISPTARVRCTPDVKAAGSDACG